jgi:hypothetical protein
MSGGRRIAARRGGRRCERFLTASRQGRERFLMAFRGGCGRYLLRRGRPGSWRRRSGEGARRPGGAGWWSSGTWRSGTCGPSGGGRAGLPSPAAVTRDIALALLEVEAGCRSATQLERVFSPELWGALEHRIGRRGGPLPSGRSLISVRCQEDAPGLADTVAVVQKATWSGRWRFAWTPAAAAGG